MKTAITDAFAINGTDHRLDASYHASDGVRALRFIRNWADENEAKGKPETTILRENNPSYEKNQIDLLGDICIHEGIFIGSRIKRNYVIEEDHGVPFLSSSDMLLTSFEAVNLISNTQPQLDSMKLQDKWILISRSGTIGNVVYTHEKMAGLAASEHIMRVVPDKKLIPPGYVYTYLSCPLGQSIVKSGTYGTVVNTISSEFVSNIPVPRLDSSTEESIHQLIEKAADQKALAVKLIEKAQNRLFEKLSLPRLTRREALTKGLWCFSIPYEKFGQFTLNAWRYNPVTQSVLSKLEAIQHKKLKSLIANDGVYYGNQFKRIDADPSVGIMLLSQTHTFQERPQGRWISKNSVSNHRDFMVPDGAILVAAQGTMGDSELFGRCQFSHRNFENHMIMQHILRIIPDASKVDPGYLFAFLSSEYGFHLFRSTACGTKLLSFILDLVEQFPIPTLPQEQQNEIGSLVYQAYDSRADALSLEDRAQAILLEALGWEGS